MMKIESEEGSVYAEGDYVNINHYRERKAGVTTYYVVKIMKILPNGFMNVEYDSRQGEVKKIHTNDIVRKTTRICTMDVPSYKEHRITVKQKPKTKPYVFLSEVLWVVDEVLDHRFQGGMDWFLIKWEEHPSNNWWQPRDMLPPSVVKEGDALIVRKANEIKKARIARSRERTKRVRNIKVENRRNIKKEEDSSY